MSVVEFKLENLIAEITVNRPEQLNALNSSVLAEIKQHLKFLETTLAAPSGFESVRVLVVRGAGPKAFVAGADIAELTHSSAEQITVLIAQGHAVMNALSELPIPVIAAVDGFALGGGCELALACDLIVASTQAVFGLPEISLGLIPGFGGTQRLAARIGAAGAKKMIFTGERVSAENALAMGLCDYLFEKEVFQERLSEYVEQLRDKAPLALAAAKRAITSQTAQILDIGLCRESGLFGSVRKSEDAQRGLEAFLKKSKVTFKGQ